MAQSIVPPLYGPIQASRIVALPMPQRGSVKFVTALALDGSTLWITPRAIVRRAHRALRRSAA